MQNNIALKIDETLEKSWIFHYSKSDGLGIVSALIVMADITENFQRTRRTKVLVIEVLTL